MFELYFQMGRLPDKSIGIWQTIFQQLTQFVLAYGFDPGIINPGIIVIFLLQIRRNECIMNPNLTKGGERYETIRSPEGQEAV